LTRSIAADYGRDGVRANCICPGAVETEMLTVWLRSFGEGEADARARLVARAPLARMGRAEEIANLACFLASDEASYMTGTVIPVEGGTSAVGRRRPRGYRKLGRGAQCTRATCAACAPADEPHPRCHEVADATRRRRTLRRTSRPQPSGRCRPTVRWE